MSKGSEKRLKNSSFKRILSVIRQTYKRIPIGKTNVKKADGTA